MKTKKNRFNDFVRKGTNKFEDYFGGTFQNFLFSFKYEDWLWSILICFKNQQHKALEFEISTVTYLFLMWHMLKMLKLFFVDCFSIFSTHNYQLDTIQFVSIINLPITERFLFNFYYNMWFIFNIEELLYSIFNRSFRFFF